jgi:hypothetical protein
MQNFERVLTRVKSELRRFRQSEVVIASNALLAYEKTATADKLITSVAVPPDTERATRPAPREL